MSQTSPTKPDASPLPCVNVVLPPQPPTTESPNALHAWFKRNWPWCVSLSTITIAALLGLILWRTWGTGPAPSGSSASDSQSLFLKRELRADIQELMASQAKVMFPSLITQPDGPGIERLLYTFVTELNGDVRVELTQGSAFYHQWKSSNLTIETTNGAFVCTVEKPGDEVDFYLHRGTLSSPADCFDGPSSVRDLPDGLIPGVMRQPVLRMTLALGKDGYDGLSHPGLLPLYNIAMKVGRQAGLDGALPADEVNEANEKVMSQQGTQAGKFGRLSAKCPLKPYKHPKCSNTCFGKCGPDCSCWAWVCGDCDCYRGCENHDYWCSCYGLWHPRCFSFSAAVAGTCGCCHGPDDTPGP